MRQLVLGSALAALLAATAACSMANRDGLASASDSGGAQASSQAALAAAVAASTRTPANVARDRYRHPVETLSFFGVRPNHNVVELWPGGGWYTEILAPYLAQGGGTYYAAALGGRAPALTKMMEANPALYGNIRIAAFPAFDASETRVPDGSADVVLTFRNAHNWVQGYQRNGQDYSAEAFAQIYRMLKPGGTLGVVDHRLPENADAGREKTSGYVKVSTVRRLAEQAGFRFAGSSEVNANPKDTADWPDGVWTLPPALRLKDVAREKYLAIGESDRMTLKFTKPR